MTLLFSMVMASAAAHAQTPPPSTPEPPPMTVTAADGDVGGLYFGKVPDPAHTRHYYIAAEPVLWDFAPEVNDAVCGKPLPPSAPLNHQMVSKIRYVQYTDATFQARVVDTPRLGILGPVLRGVTGDFLAVTFLNRASQPLSMHPHGVRYDKDSEGAYFPPAPGKGSAVGPGATFTYVWHLNEASAPLPDEPSSKVWLYHSHVMGDSEVNLGLVGCIIVTDVKRARPDGTPNDIDREMATLYLIFDESGVDPEAYEYVGLPGGPPAKPWAEVMELQELGSRYSINGRTFGNLKGLEMNEGERVRWYLLGMGSERDFHTAHWHGMTVIEESRRRTDVIELLPATMKIADMLADNPGSWLYHCHVAEHMTEGMFTRYTIHAKNDQKTQVSRSPDVAFLGLNQAAKSLEIKHAEYLPNGHLRLAGSVTVFEAFTIFNQPVELTVNGAAPLTFNPDSKGRALASNATWQIRNADPLGIIRGGLLEFECDLPENIAKSVNATKVLKISLKIGTASHRAETTVVSAPR